MESPDYSPTSHMDASRPSLGFPLGTALLLIIIFSLSGVFSCCYHWEKLRSLRRSYWEDEDVVDMESGSVKTKHTLKSKKQEHIEQSFTVAMPGDKVPKFIAMPCPCQTPRQSEEERAASQGQKPLKSPRIAVPLY